MIFLGWFWVVVGQFRPLLWPGSHFVIYESSLEPQYLYLGSFIKTRVVGYLCNSCQAPWQSRTWHLGDNFGCVFANSVHFCGRRDPLWSRNPLLSLNYFTWGHLMKIEWLLADVKAVGLPDRAERDILGVILDVFWSIQGIFSGQFRPLLASDSHFVM